MKEFMEQWTKKNLKRMEKEDITGLLYDLLPDLVSYYIRKGHHTENRELVETLFAKMVATEPDFLKHLKRVVKADDFSPVNPSVATIISDLLAYAVRKDSENLRNDENAQPFMSDEMKETYKKLIGKILGKRVDKLSKKLGLSNDYISELLVVVPDPDVVGDAKYLGNYVFRILRKMYALAKEGDTPISDTKTIRKLFKGIFGEDMLNYVAVNVLLERKDNISRFNNQQIELWNLVTEFALDQIESNDKEEVRNLITYFVERREKDADKGRDFARRIPLTSIADDVYTKIAKAVSKVSEKEKLAKFL
jgi:hypothetical protein